MKMTVTVQTFEINDEDIRILQQDSSFMETCPRLLIPHGKTRTKRKTRSRRRVTASELIHDLIEGIKK